MYSVRDGLFGLVVRKPTTSHVTARHTTIAFEDIKDLVTICIRECAQPPKLARQHVTILRLC